MKTNIGWEDAVNPEKIRWMNRYIEFSRSPKILELGAGAGWYSIYAAGKGATVTSLDQAPVFEDKRIDIRTANIENKLELDNDAYDVVLAWDIIEHVANEKRLLAEIYRVLKQDGLVLVSVPHADDSRIAGSYLTYCHYKDKTHQREYTPETLKNAFQSLGFTIGETRLHGGHGYPYLILNFIDNPFAKLLVKFAIKILIKTRVIDIKNAHGDIFMVVKR